MDKGKRISRGTWLRGGAEVAEELRAIGERAKLERARAVLWARMFRGAPPWPGREESDRRFREAWEALERDAAMAQRGWEPDIANLGSSCATSESQDLRFDEAGAVCETMAGQVSEDDRDILLAWLGTGSPIARRVMAWLLGLDAATASAILGEGAQT